MVKHARPTFDIASVRPHVFDLVPMTETIDDLAERIRCQLDNAPDKLRSGPPGLTSVECAFRFTRGGIVEAISCCLSDFDDAGVSPQVRRWHRHESGDSSNFVLRSSWLRNSGKMRGEEAEYWFIMS